MKFVRFGECGKESPGIIDNQGKIRDISGYITDLNASTIENLDIFNEMNLETLPLVETSIRLGPCINNIGKILCIGLNYVNHAAETKMELPKEPVLFMKATSSICGPNDPIIIPRNSQKTDWEVELGVVIGKKAKYVSKEDALSYVAGYCAVNDVSEREFQLERGGQWVKGKSCDSFAPIGPWLVTADEVEAPQKLNLWLKVNGEMRQNSTTGDMIFNVAYLISHLSQFMTLHPGDIISTGTPPGVGLGMNPPTYLKEGDVVELGVEGLGVQKQLVILDK